VPHGKSMNLNKKRLKEKVKSVVRDHPIILAQTFITALSLIWTYRLTRPRKIDRVVDSIEQLLNKLKSIKLDKR